MKKAIILISYESGDCDEKEYFLTNPYTNQKHERRKIPQGSQM